MYHSTVKSIKFSHECVHHKDEQLLDTIVYVCVRVCIAFKKNTRRSTGTVVASITARQVCATSTTDVSEPIVFSMMPAAECSGVHVCLSLIDLNDIIHGMQAIIDSRMLAHRVSASTALSRQRAIQLQLRILTELGYWAAARVSRQDSTRCDAVPLQEGMSFAMLDGFDTQQRAFRAWASHSLQQRTTKRRAQQLVPAWPAAGGFTYKVRMS